MKEKLFVTRSFLPAKEEFLAYIDTVFASHTVTNQGTLVRTLEQRLAAFLNVPHVLSCANGTLGLMMALRLAGVHGKKVITTPFTYVATLSALLWERCIPVFADIDPETLCLCPESLRQCLQRHPDAAGVMPVHIFGNACDVHAIEAICEEHHIVCVYDACHAFGSSYHGRSVLDYGDHAVCSFHATKLFHTVEGGCIVSHSDEDNQQGSLLRAFGHVGDEHYALGFNAKMSELHAAMGLTILPYITAHIEARRKSCAYYEAHLPKGLYTRPKLADGLVYNHAYFPIMLEDEQTVLHLVRRLAEEHIFPRRYFYPSLTTLPYLPDATTASVCPVADDAALRIVCLPLHAEMTEQELARVVDAIRRL